MGTNLPASPRAYTSWSQDSESICSASLRRLGPSKLLHSLFAIRAAWPSPWGPGGNA